MRNIALSLTLATVTLLLAQSSSSYRITHTYPVGGDGSWDYIVPDPPNASCRTSAIFFYC